MDKPEIIYPCEWSYRIVGSSEEEIRDGVKAILKDKMYAIEVSNKSGKGTYISLRLVTEVANEAERVTIFEAIKGLDIVKMVL